jgi:hypothetical protein
MKQKCKTTIKVAIFVISTRSSGTRLSDGRIERDNCESRGKGLLKPLASPYNQQPFLIKVDLITQYCMGAHQKERDIKIFQRGKNKESRKYY